MGMNGLRVKLFQDGADLDAMIDELGRGRLDGEVPAHGTLARVRQHIPSERAVGVFAPDDVTSAPVWMPPPTEAPT